MAGLVGGPHNQGQCIAQQAVLLHPLPLLFSHTPLTERDGLAMATLPPSDRRGILLGSTSDVGWQDSSGFDKL